MARIADPVLRSRRDALVRFGDARGLTVAELSLIFHLDRKKIAEILKRPADEHHQP